jgi:hypothetical protein
MPMWEERKGLLQYFGAELAGLFLLVLIPMPWLIFVAAIVMLLWPFALLIHWHCLSPEEQKRLTTPPKTVERKPAGPVARILASAFCAAMALFFASLSVHTFLIPKPDYFAAGVMVFGSVFSLGLIRWIWRPGWSPA